MRRRFFNGNFKAPSMRHHDLVCGQVPGLGRPQGSDDQRRVIVADKAFTEVAKAKEIGKDKELIKEKDKEHGKPEKDVKDHKEGKDHKDNKEHADNKAHKDSKDSKDQKDKDKDKDGKDHKDGKDQKDGKNEAKDKHEKEKHEKEIKDHKEHKELAKEKEHKEFAKDKEHKELEQPLASDPFPPAAGMAGLDPGAAQRLSALEATVAQLLHFIPSDLRPDLAAGALAQEPDAKKAGADAGAADPAKPAASSEGDPKKK
jgi:hypothetical protein